MLTATLSTIWGSAHGLDRIVIDGWNVAVPILLIAVAARTRADAQALRRGGGADARQPPRRHRVDRVDGPVMVGGDDGALGFSSLALFGVRSIGTSGSPAPMHRERVLLEMTFIPALRSLLPVPRRVPAEAGSPPGCSRSCTPRSSRTAAGASSSPGVPSSRSRGRRALHSYLRLDTRVHAARQHGAPHLTEIEKHFRAR